jgi:AcrR family transcriptional regulator
MATYRAKKTLSRGEEFRPEKWVALGGPPNPTVREQIIMLTVEEIIAIGPADFNAASPCDRIGVKHPTVNYHFGNRDGLLAEATMWAHDSWVRFLHNNLLAAPKNAKKRLRAFIDSEIAWSKKMGGMMLLMHYPLASQGSQQIVAEEYSERMQRNFEFNLALLTTMVLDIRNKTLTPLTFTVDDYPKVELLRHPSAVLAATSISWATHGIASWSIGSHIATRNMESSATSKLTTSVATEHYIKQIMRLADK